MKSILLVQSNIIHQLDYKQVEWLYFPNMKTWRACGYSILSFSLVLDEKVQHGIEVRSIIIISSWLIKACCFTFFFLYKCIMSSTLAISIIFLLWFSHTKVFVYSFYYTRKHWYLFALCLSFSDPFHVPTHAQHNGISIISYQLLMEACTNWSWNGENKIVSSIF